MDKVSGSGYLATLWSSHYKNLRNVVNIENRKNLSSIYTQNVINDK